MSEAEFSLVMPFVVVTSKGGPYDDGAFVAGARYGQIAERLRIAEHMPPTTFRDTVESAMVPQYDLLAMHHGFTLTAEPWEDAPDEWTLVTFRTVWAVPDETEGT